MTYDRSVRLLGACVRFMCRNSGGAGTSHRHYFPMLPLKHHPSYIPQLGVQKTYSSIVSAVLKVFWLERQAPMG